MKTKPNPSIDRFFEQARKQAATPPETPLLSEQDIKRLLNTLPVMQAKQKQERSALQGLMPYMTEYLATHWGRFAFAGGLCAVLIWASMEMMPNHPTTGGEIPIRQSKTQETALKRELTTSSANETKGNQAQSRITATKRNKAFARFATKRYVAYREPYILSDDTPCYNPESTRSSEEKLMREMLFFTLIAETMTEINNYAN